MAPLRKSLALVKSGGIGVRFDVYEANAVPARMFEKIGHQPVPYAKMREIGIDDQVLQKRLGFPYLHT